MKSIFLVAITFFTFSSIKTFAAEVASQAVSAATVASAATTAKTPVLFSVVGNELRVQPPLITYYLNKKDKNQHLKVGNLIFDHESITAKIEKDTLIIKWDTKLVTSGTITMVNTEGQTLWTEQTTAEGNNSFSNFTEKNVANLKNKIHFCLQSHPGNEYVSICSQWYKSKVNGTDVSLNAVTKASTKARITFQNKPQPSYGSLDVPTGTPAHFLATLNTEATYIFVSEPVAPEIKDMISSEKPGYLTLKVGDSSVEISRQYPELNIPGKTGGVFTYPLIIKDPPEQKDRHFITEHTLLESYLEYDQITATDNTNTIKYIKAHLPEKYTINKVTLDVPGKELTHKAYLDVYRGAPREVSIRLTEVLSGGKTLLFGEGHGSWWFNDVFGSQNYYFSKLRWGLTAKYFTGFSKLPASDNTTTQDVDFKSLQVDLRYRITPGLWLKTPTLGAITAYEKVDIGSTSAAKLGIGAFGTYPMPKFLDNVMNKASFLNHPKWLNIEYIKYVAATSNDISLGNDYTLNFHGKMLYTPRYIFEAGFGLKNYYFTKKSDLTGASLAMLYATIGVGINF